MTSAVLFWSAVTLVAYVHLGFPLLLWLRAWFAPRPHRTGDLTPSVSLVICAHDEASCIAAKLENIAALDYPPERREVIIASDGSSDGTDAIVRRESDESVRLLSLPRIGKIAALNAAVRAARGEILVFTDANSRFERGALRALVRAFADPEVGGVAGDQRYVPEGASGVIVGERRYWSFDRQLKRWQSCTGSVTSATGAIHALRRELYREVPPGVTDDFFVSTRAIAAGRRLVFAPDAVAWERPATGAGAEFRRKQRVATRGLRAVIAARGLLDPRRTGFYALQLFTHKLLRRLLVLPLLVLLVTSPLLWEHGAIYQLATLGQAALYTAALLGWLLGSREGLLGPLGVAHYFVLVNAACLVATVNLLCGRRIDQWETAQRAPERLSA